MKVVIDIPEESFNILKYKASHNIAECIIASGTPLPEVHGRLIDADALYKHMYVEAFEKDSDLQKWDSGCWIRFKMFENCLDAAPTILD